MPKKNLFLPECLPILKRKEYTIQKNGRNYHYQSEIISKINMSNSKQLSKIQRINGGGKELTQTSSKMDNLILTCVDEIKIKLQNQYHNRINLCHEKKIYLKDIVAKLRKIYPNEDWLYNFETSTIKPDGGILYLIDKSGKQYPILIAEQKSQGTNNRVIQETGKKQARGNAIERLGKNLIGLRTWLKDEEIFPFVCFGSGCDFEQNSSILDRVSTMAEFSKLNNINLFATVDSKRCPGSFYFHEKALLKNDFLKIMMDIAERSILYYFSKYGKESFIE